MTGIFLQSLSCLSVGFQEKRWLLLLVQVKSDGIFFTYVTFFNTMGIWPDVVVDTTWMFFIGIQKSIIDIST